MAASLNYMLTLGGLNPMSEKHRQTLQASRTHLVKYLDISEIMDYMIQYGVICEEKQDIISSKTTRQDRTRTFLDILKRCDENAFDIFLESLNKSSPHLADFLRLTLQEVSEAMYSFGAEDNHQSVQCNQASVSTFPSDASYIDDIVKKISDIAYYGSNTQKLVCKSNCEAYILNEGIGISSPEDSDVSQKKVIMAAGECLFISLALKIELDQWANKGPYIRVWDGKGRLLAVPAEAVKIYGDPCGEPWFHPGSLSAAQANMILTPYQKPGVFLLYIPQQKNDNSEVKFNLSVLVRKGNGFKTMHYHVKGLNGGRVKLSADEQDYCCIQKLIAHFKNNRGCLPCCLRMSPKEVDRKVLPGENYDMKWYIRENALEFSDHVLQGTYGNVLQATLGNLPVAVKYQSLYLRDNPWAFENFLEEAKILSQLDHRNIIQLQGFCFNSAEKPYIVMEFLFGGSLQQAIKNKQVGKSLEDVTMMFKQVLFALCYLENKSYIIHRRVAACNFLMGESQCLKLVDFGLARIVSQDCFTNGDHDKISVRWSAPEVLSNGQFSTKSDMWSAGVVLWEILSDGSEKPYGSLTSREIISIFEAGGRLRCPNGNDASVKDIFKVVTTRCWRGSVNERSSAYDLLDVISTRLNSHKESISQAALS